LFWAPQRISTGFASWLRYCSYVAQRKPTKLCTMFGRLGSAGTLRIRFRGLLPHNGILQVQNSLCVQVLRSPILALLLHGTRVLGVRQTLRRSAKGATYTRQGGYHVWALAHILVVFSVSALALHLLLWPPCVADADIIFCSCGF